MKSKLSVVLATWNEEKNIGPCLRSVKRIFSDLPAQEGEIIVVDEGSKDKTREIAKSYGAIVTKVGHEANFHITKQKAIDKAKGDWILQMDADERVSPDLADEIVKVINSTNEELKSRNLRHSERPKGVEESKIKLFRRHQSLIEQREGTLASGSESLRARRGQNTGIVVAFFIPRVNYFLGKPLIHAGVYPDGVIRLFKKGKARLPGKSVHELMEVDGEIGWLFNDLEHHESPTLKRYIDRMNRYTDIKAQELQNSKTPRNIWYFCKYTVHRPLLTFMNLYLRHKGFLDGMRGFLWSFLSALHFPISYFKYWTL